MDRIVCLYYYCHSYLPTTTRPDVTVKGISEPLFGEPHQNNTATSPEPTSNPQRTVPDISQRNRAPKIQNQPQYWNKRTLVYHSLLANPTSGPQLRSSLNHPLSPSSLDQHPDIQCHTIPSTRKTSLPLNSPPKLHHRRKTPSQKRPQAKSRHPKSLSQGSWLSSLSAPPEVMNTSRAPLPAVCQICRSHR